MSTFISPTKQEITDFRATVKALGMPFIKTEQDIDCLLAVWLEDINEEPLSPSGLRSRVKRIRHPQADDEYQSTSRARQRAKTHGCVNTLTLAEWRIVLARFKGCCAYCGTDEGRIQLDHIIAFSRGGENTKENVLPACNTCNQFKRRIDRVTVQNYCPMTVAQARELILAWVRRQRKNTSLGLS